MRVCVAAATAASTIIYINLPNAVCRGGRCAYKVTHIVQSRTRERKQEFLFDMPAHAKFIWIVKSEINKENQTTNEK